MVLLSDSQLMVYSKYYKVKRIRILALLLFLICVVMIVPSGFRGDVGPDSRIYRIIFDNVVESGSADYGVASRDILFRLLLIQFERLKWSYESFQFFGMAFSLFVLALAYLKSESRSFVVFASFYLAFIYYQAQWSTIRFMYAFWALSFIFLMSKKVSSGFLVSSLFHASFILGFFVSWLRKIPAALSLLLGACVGLVMYLTVYLKHYGATSLIDEYVFGGPVRFLIHLLYLIIILKILSPIAYRRLLFSRSKAPVLIFMTMLPLGLMMPIGWRVLAIFTPLLLIADLRYVRLQRAILCVFLLIFIFIQKTVSFHLREGGEETVFIFIINFYAGLF